VFEHTVLVGSIEGVLRSLNVQTGAVVWSRSIGDPIGGSPAVWAGRAYVATQSRRWVAAVDARTGATVWKVKLALGGTESSPVLAGGSVYVLAYGSLIALDTATGRIRWHTDGLGGHYDATPAVADGRVFVASRIPSQMAAVDAQTGAVLWTTPVDQDLWSSVSVATGVVYAGGDALNAFDASTGQVLWTTNVGEYFTEPIVVDGRLYYSGGDNHVYAFGLP
jgi:outer membrane protein assembly factor BamB